MLLLTLVCLAGSLQAAVYPNWKNTCGNTQKQSILSLTSTDIITRHLNSGVLNSTLGTCDNFHRHFCPKAGLPDSASTQGLFNEILDIELACSKYDVYPKIENHFNFAAQFDNFNYTNNASLSSLIFLLPKSTLITIYEYVTLNVAEGAKFYSFAWNRRHWSAAIDQSVFPAKYDPTTFTNLVKRKAFVDTLANNIVTIVKAAGGVAAMKTYYLPFLKKVTDYYHILNVLYRDGLQTGARDAVQETILGAAKQWGAAVEAAAWSSVDSDGETRYQRFYDKLMDVYDNTLHGTLNNIGTQDASLTLARDFHNFYLEERASLSPLFVLPYLRTFIAASRAYERTLATFDLDLPYRWNIVKVANPNAISGYFAWVCVRNQVIFDLISANSPKSALFGTNGYTYGHELYHGIQWTFAEIMPTSPVVSASAACPNTFFADVATRFPGDARFLWWPTEEEADVYGTQTAYNSLVTALGTQIDDLAYPSLNITHRQLFFYANSIFGCNVHTGEYTTYLTMPDAHYEVNGRLAQVPDFQSTFHCAATDNMVFPSSEHCPPLFPTYTA